MIRLDEQIPGILGGGKILRTIFFPSKKNQVSLVYLRQNKKTLPVIAKFFVWGDAVKEAEVLTACRAKQIHVPKIIGQSENLLLLEYLPGKSLKECCGEGSVESCLPPLAGWMSLFHAAFDDGKDVLLKGDMTLQNFIISRGRLWGFDFEESARGRRETDIAQLCVSLLCLGEGFEDWNFSVCRKFIALYEKVCSKSLEGVSREAAQELKRRAKYLPALAGIYRRQAALLEAGGVRL
ncbi:MAG: hypothetical protein V2A78_12685 [bacterium]